MYWQPVLLMGIGGCLLIGNVFMLLRDYKYNLTVDGRKNKLWMNALVILSAIGIVVLGTIQLFIINQQL